MTFRRATPSDAEAIVAMFRGDHVGANRQLSASLPRTGVGRFAMRETLRWAFGEIGVHRAYLDVRESNVPARAFYESFGFVLEGTWREGFRAAGGTYHDLCAYGLLAREYRALTEDLTKL